MQKRNPCYHFMRSPRLIRQIAQSLLNHHQSPLPPPILPPKPYGKPSISEVDRGFSFLYNPKFADSDFSVRFGSLNDLSLNSRWKRTDFSVALIPLGHFNCHSVRNYFSRSATVKKTELDDASQRAVTTALWCNFLVFSLKFGVWLNTSSHVMLAEVVHSVADFANQALLAYGLSSSRRAPDALHPYGYSKERFVWSLISAVGIFCLGSGATIVHGFQNLWSSQPPPNIHYAALVIGGSFIIEGASLVVAVNAVKRGAAAEGMKVRDYVWRGHDPTSVAVMTEDGAAVTGLAIAAASLVAVNKTGNAIYDPIGSIVVGNLLGMVAIFLIQRNRHALIGRAIDDHDMERVLRFLKSDPVVDALYDCKSEVIGPGFFRFKAEIDFNGAVVVRNYLKRTGREEWARQGSP